MPFLAPHRSTPAARPAGPPPRFPLALGSGGARGYAHIGVINELCDRGYQIVGVTGSSMGALVGGLQAAGRLDDFADWAIEELAIPNTAVATDLIAGRSVCRGDRHRPHPGRLRPGHPGCRATDRTGKLGA